ncbi:hypothetical protein [Sphingomonas sp. Y38-1Y]|uniref:GFA family protein n=1 Tax=Sphingomonas sp. Y38-1Y TaxID=3078265 RepID=UPI0028F106D9|nr:hypothetical protein [Sphingomonas sp. Y38-1Y]
MIEASCHCGRNKLRVDAELPDKVVRCTCSFCSKRGLLHAYFAPDQLIVDEASSDAIYRWNHKLVAHHFCSACGCSLYSDSPAFGEDGEWDGETRKVGMNARIIDGVEAADLPVDVIDGKTLW